MSVWPSLVEGDRRFLPNPKNISGNYSMVPPETKRDAEPPLRNAADRDYGGEETTVPPAQPQRVKRHELDLAAEPSVLAKGCFTTPTTSRGGLTARPNQLTVRKMWCCPEPGARWRPIQTFPRCNTWSAVTEAFPECCDVGAFLKNFWLLTRECERKHSKQQTADSQIINSYETILEMNIHVSSENSCEAWMATGKRDLAELQRLNVQINLRSNYELRRAAAEQPHRPRTPTVPPPGPRNEERRRTGSADAPEDVDIVELVQGTTESAESWFTESARRAITHGRQYKSSGHDTATKTPSPRDPDLDVITLKIVRSPVPQYPEPSPQDRVLDYRRKMEPYWSGTLFPGKQRSMITQEHDNNDNVIIHPPQQAPMRRYAESVSSEPQAASHQLEKEYQQIGPRKIGDYEYHEEEPLGSDTQEPYLASDDSYESDDDGHRDCGRGGYHACPDNPANFHMYEEEADDITVIDVFNTNQELRLGEGSDTEPSSNGDRDSFGEDGFGLEETR
jgi:hypothetical protein